MKLVDQTLAMLAFVAVPCLSQGLLPRDVVLLRHAKTHVKDEVEHLPDYTCLETIQRFRSGPHGKGGLKPLDTVRVEVLYSGRKELFAAHGARDFHDDSPVAFAAGGLSGTGAFALNLVSIFVDDNAMTQYRGEEELEGRRAARYEYRVPLLQSGYTIELPGGSGRVATKGSFWLDPQTLDVLRIDSTADEIPPSLPLAESTSTVRYERTKIGERSVMLPGVAEIHLKTSDGEMSRNVMQFTHCRAFQSESTLTFGADATGLPSAVPASGGLPPSVDAELSLPGGLVISIGLSSALNQDDVPGEQIEGRVLADVLSKGAVVVREGTIVRGRLRTLHKSGEAAGYTVVSLEFTELETGGQTGRFFADLEEIQTVGGATRRIGGVNDAFSFQLEELPGVGSFFVKGEKFDLPAGFRTVWKTRPLQ